MATLGTAGHIDHGKTALIRALTGTDTDRLPEERARGISIELGYAQLELASNRRLSVIDVPGHERFVRTMVAGATGIDLYLMVVAADDGVMPQTREHAMVLRALGIDTGVVAITKSDLADPALAAIEADELLPGVEVVPVSARTGEGLEALRDALQRQADRVLSRVSADAPACLHIDRVFTIRGAGTVVTGTLWSGAMAQGDELRLLPRGLRARVRAVQVHDQPTGRAEAGQRVAVNLIGIPVDEVARGDVLTGDPELRPTYRLDARLDVAEVPRRVQVHHGTRETPARLRHVEADRWRLLLERPLVPAAGDRLVLRQIAPPDTLGGAIVVDPCPGPPTERAEGQSAASGCRFRAASGRLPDRAIAVEQRLEQAHLEPPPDSELDAAGLQALREAGKAIRVTKNLHFHPAALAEARERIVALAERNGGSVTLAALRDELGTSRKYAQALLEHFDSERVTIRRGEVHVLRRQARPV